MGEEVTGAAKQTDHCRKNRPWLAVATRAQGSQGAGSEVSPDTPDGRGPTLGRAGTRTVRTNQIHPEILDPDPSLGAQGPGGSVEGCGRVSEGIKQRCPRLWPQSVLGCLGPQVTGALRINSLLFLV